MQIAAYQLGTDWVQPQTEDEAVALASDLITGTHPLAVDVETKSLKDRTPIGISICPTPNISFYYPLWPEVSPYVPWRELLRTDRTLVMHNCMYDLDVMDGKLQTANIYDTMMACRYEGLPLALGDISPAFGIEIEPISEILPKGKDMTEIEPELVVRKCSKDTIATFRLYQEAKDETNWLMMNLDMDVVPILLKMSRRGVAVDPEMVEILVEKYTKEAQYYRDICQGYGFSPGSRYQTGVILSDRGNIMPQLTKVKKQIKVDEKVLRKLEDPLAAVVLNYSQAQGMLSKGLNRLRGHSRVYGKYGINSATGRTTCSGANLPAHINFQQLFAKDDRREIRNVFVPDTGTWTDWDYSQLELRVLAYASQDPAMLEVFEGGGDIHQDAADRCNIPRKIAKNCNFALTYGASEDTIAETGNFTLDVARNLLNLMRGAYPRLFSYMDEMKAIGVREGKVEDIYGRVYHLEEQGIDLKQMERNAVNYPTQGPASTIFKRSMLLIEEGGFDQAIEVHDQDVLDGRVEVPVEELENIAEFKTPIEIKYLERWE